MLWTLFVPLLKCTALHLGGSVSKKCCVRWQCRSEHRRPVLRITMHTIRLHDQVPQSCSTNIMETGTLTSVSKTQRDNLSFLSVRTNFMPVPIWKYSSRCPLGSYLNTASCTSLSFKCTWYFDRFLLAVIAAVRALVSVIPALFSVYCFN